jgi:hypothetical protein
MFLNSKWIQMGSSLKITVEDVETGSKETYDYSKDNWRKAFACMKGDAVHMWAPEKCALGLTIRTSGRRWTVHK